LKSPVRRTGPLDVEASYLPLIRSRDAPYLRCSSDTWSRWVLRTVSGFGQARRRKRAAVQIRLHPAPGKTETLKGVGLYESCTLRVFERPLAAYVRGEELTKAKKCPERPT